MMWAIFYGSFDSMFWGLKCLPLYVGVGSPDWGLKYPYICRCWVILLGFKVNRPICGCWIIWLGIEVSPPICGCWVTWDFYSILTPYIIPYNGHHTYELFPSQTTKMGPLSFFFKHQTTNPWSSSKIIVGKGLLVVLGLVGGAITLVSIKSWIAWRGYNTC